MPMIGMKKKSDDRWNYRPIGGFKLSINAFVVKRH
jgi:hypothetical protein